MSEDTSARTGKLILVPALITLAVTILRLVGELQGWSPRLFSREAGGGGALVGIAWLVPVFGAWFGWALARAGRGPAGVGRALGLAVAALLIVPLAGVITTVLGMNQQSFVTFAVFVVAAVVGVIIGLRAWPELGRVLVAYGLAARIPVALVMLAAMLGNWGTHYDAAPPDFPAMSPMAKWFTLGLVPQFTIWIWFTVAIGSVVGIAAAAVAVRRGRATRGIPARV